MEHLRAPVIRMRLAAGDTIETPEAKIRIEVLARLLAEHIAECPANEANDIRRGLEGLVQAMEELGPKADLRELFARVWEITSARH